VPAGRQDRLHLVRTRIDGLIPRQSALLTEGRHRLDELVDLRIDQVLPVAGLQIFNLIGGRTGVPILDGELVCRTVNRQTQVIDLPRNHKIKSVLELKNAV
jgi:hypothetical protein